MAEYVLGVFDNEGDATRAVEALRQAGFDPERIQLIRPRLPEDERQAASRLGAMTGGLIGGTPEQQSDLLGLGLSPEETGYYSGRVDNGSLIVGVDAPGREFEAHSILLQNGAENAQRDPDADAEASSQVETTALETPAFIYNAAGPTTGSIEPMRQQGILQEPIGPIPPDQPTLRVSSLDQAPEGSVPEPDTEHGGVMGAAEGTSMQTAPTASEMPPQTMPSPQGTPQETMVSGPRRDTAADRVTVTHTHVMTNTPASGPTSPTSPTSPTNTNDTNAPGQGDILNETMGPTHVGTPMETVPSPAGTPYDTMRAPGSGPIDEPATQPPTPSDYAMGTPSAEDDAGPADVPELGTDQPRGAAPSSYANDDDILRDGEQRR